VSDSTLALLGTAVATSLFHTLIPDHWLPFVLIGRAQGWSPLRAAWVAGLSALVHTLLSIGLGVFAVAVELQAVEWVGQSLERAAAVLLVVSGLVYAAWAWRKGGHFHPGGQRLHRHDAEEGCTGEEGPSHHEHLHYHADTTLIRERSHWGAVGLALIVGLNPCVVILPVLLASASRGWPVVGLVAVAYGVPTLLLMVVLSALGVRGAQRIRLPWPARYMELASGLALSVLGILFWIFHD
jgi:ABC-type nickel/cobalt efflux system permease component RcnA